MCQACVPGVSVDGYDCDSDLDFHSDDECACPHDHQQHHDHDHKHEHEHEHEHENDENGLTKEEDKSGSQTVTFPSDAFFTRLINAAHQSKDEIIISDETHGLQLTYSKFLYDVQALRAKIQSAVPADLLDANGGFKEGVGYVGVLADIQYPFFVASLAILAMGGVIVPMGRTPGAEQVVAVLEASKAVALVFELAEVDLASAVQKESASLAQIPIEINLAEKDSGKDKQIRFITTSTDDLVFSPDRPALLLYSDSKEPDVLTRQTFYDRATGDSNSETAERTDAMMVCIIICLSCGPPAS